MSTETLFQRFPAWTVAEIFRRTATTSPDKTFLAHPEASDVSYGAFLRQSEALARHLASLGLQKGDRLAILAPAGLPTLHGWMAAALGGFIDVTLHPNQRGAPLAHAFDMAQPKALLVAEDHLERVLEINPFATTQYEVILIGGSGERPPRSDGLRLHSYEAFLTGGKGALDAPDKHDIASIIFTSGTTGPAKAVLLPHAQVALLAWITATETGMTPEDRFYAVHPLNHIAGKFMAVLATAATGGTVCMDNSFAPERWIERIHETGATLTIAHGPMIEMIHNRPPSALDNSHSMKRMMCCPLPSAIGGDFTARFNLRSIEMWGMTEVGCPCWTSQQESFVTGSCGRVLQDWFEMKVLDPQTDLPVPSGEAGEFCVRPRLPWTAMQGYSQQPDAYISAWRNQWFHTGDSGYVDADGNFFFIDRMGDRIRRRAENISSYEIEAAANSYPGIRESAAVGVPSAYEGDSDILLVIVSEGEAPAPEALLRHLLEKLPHFMVPRYIRTIPSLPRTPTNKVRKQMLRDEGITEDTWDRSANNISLRRLAESRDGGERPI